MIEVEMTNDIRKFKTKTFAMFTTRQLACIGIGALIGAPLALIINVSISDKIMIFLGCMIVLGMFGYISMDGMPFEVLLMRLAYLKVLTNPKRKVELSNTFKDQMDMRYKRKELKRLNKMDSAKRKAYQNAKKKKIVIYSHKKEYTVYK